MNKKNDCQNLEKEFLNNYNSNEFEKLSFTVDMTIFGLNIIEEDNYRRLDEQKLTILLVKRNEFPFKEKWSLPGGFVGINESLENASKRIIKNKLGIENIYMEQLYTFGEPKRDPRMRIVSCSYLSLVDRSISILKNSESISELDWFEVYISQEDNLIIKNSTEEFKIPIQIEEKINGKIKIKEYKIINSDDLAFDHENIILESLIRLRNKIEYSDIVYNLFPEEFTITELQQVYEIILGHKLYPAAFRRKIADRIVETGKHKKEKGHRPSQYFTYKGD